MGEQHGLLEPRLAARDAGVERTPAKGFSRSRRPVSNVRGTRAERVGITVTPN